MATIDQLHTEGFATAIDSFGEAVTDRKRIEETVARYLRVNRALAQLKPPAPPRNDLRSERRKRNELDSTHWERGKAVMPLA